MQVRIRQARESVSLAVALAFVSVAAFLGVVSGALRFGYEDRFLSVGAILALGCLSTSLSWNSRASLRDLQLGKGWIATDDEQIASRHVSGFSAAPGAYGWTVAITHDGRTTLLEVRDREEARRIARALDCGFPRVGEVRFPLGSPWLRRVQTGLSMVGLVTSWLYWQCASGRIPLSDGKPIFGLGTIGIGLLGLAVFWKRIWGAPALTVDVAGASVGRIPIRKVQSRIRRSGAPEFAMVTQRGATRTVNGAREGASWVDHAMMHASAAIEPKPDDASTEDHNLTQSLSEGSGERATWIARLDAWARESGGSGYRGTFPSKDELWRILRSAAASVDARLAAARMLRVRYGEDESQLEATTSDKEIRDRVRIVLAPEGSEAAAQLDKEGPLFRSTR